MAVLLYTRELQQKQLTLSELAVSAISVLVCTLLAWWLRSPFSLILNLILFTTMKTWVSYQIHSHRPRFTLRWGELRPYVRYSVLFNMGSGMACFAESLDKLLIGRLLGRHALGLYDRGLLLSNVAINQLPRFLASVVYPGFVTVLHQPERFRRLEHRYLSLLIALLIPSSIALYLAADPMVRWGLGENFLEAIPIFEILVLYAFCRGVVVGLQSLFDAVGNPQYRLFAYTAQVIALAVLLPTLASSLGLVGAALATTLAGAVNLAVILGALLHGAAGDHGAPVVVEEQGLAARQVVLGDEVPVVGTGAHLHEPEGPAPGHDLPHEAPPRPAGDAPEHGQARLMELPERH